MDKAGIERIRALGKKQCWKAATALCKNPDAFRHKIYCNNTKRATAAVVAYRKTLKG